MPDKMTGPTSAQVNAILDVTQLLAETTTGYFKKLIDSGIPADIAGQMAKDFHDLLMQSSGLNKRR